MNASRLILTAMIAASLLGCGNDSDSDDLGVGTLGVAVTDAPVDEADKVVVRFNGIEIKHESGSPQTIMFATSQDIDLLALQGGNAAPLITDHRVIAGNYQWLRLLVSAEFDNVFDSYIEIRGGQYELRVPPGGGTGLKLSTGFVVPQGGAANFTIDFDLRKSVVEPPGQPGYFLKPVLRMVNNVEVGTLVGTIDSAVVAGQCEDAELGAVYLFSGADVTPDDVDGDAIEPLASGMVSVAEGGEYVYQIGFLTAGEYTISYTCDAVADMPEQDDVLDFFGTQNLTITAATTTTVDFSPAVPGL